MRRGAALLAAGLLAGGCAGVSDRVVLLPEEGGRGGALHVEAAGGGLDLTQPYETAEIRRGTPTAGTTTPEEVSRRYGDVLARKPRAPVSLLVHFVSGRDALTPESQAVLERVKLEAAAAAVEIVVIGHTDRVGSVEANDRLSQARAEAVRQALVGAGVDPAIITATGRGEREPLVPTPDEAAEPRNRRVEVKLR